MNLLACLASATRPKAPIALRTVTASTDTPTTQSWGAAAPAATPAAATLYGSGDRTRSGQQYAAAEVTLTGSSLTVTGTAQSPKAWHRVWVDDQPAGDDTPHDVTSGQPYSLTVTWAAAGTRKVRIDTRYLSDLTVTTPAGSIAAATRAPDWRIAVVGDSFVESVGDNPTGEWGTIGFAWQVFTRLGNVDLASFGRGGKGWTNGAPAENYGGTQNMAALTAWDPDFVLTYGSYNDSPSGPDDPTLIGYIERFWYQVVTLPSSPSLFTVGPVPLATTTVDLAIPATLNGRLRYLGHVSPAQESWFTESDWDSAHPSRASLPKWGERISAAFHQAL